MSSSKKHFFDNPRNVQLLIKGLYVCCGILLLLELVVSRYSKHPLEWIWGFYPFYGFVGCVILVLVAKWMRKILMRDENYYGDKIESPKVSQPHDSTGEANQ